MKKLLLITMFCSVVATLQSQTLPYQNPELSARERAEDLCSRLTLEEKAQLMLDESPAIPRLGNSFGGARHYMALPTRAT